MNRQSISIVPLFLFLALVGGALVVFDRNKITDPIRLPVENLILKIRGRSSQADTAVLEEISSKIVSLEKHRDELIEENRELRRQLQAPLPSSYKFIPSIVVSHTINEESGSMLIGSGSEQGVQSGMPVVIERVLVGVVSHVTPRMATVRLLIDPESRVAVKTDRGARGIVFGLSDQSDTETILVDRVLQSEDLSVDDELSTSGEDDLPPDLLIGTVSEITTESRDPFQKALVTLSIDPRIPERVFVVRVE